jgi:hypothetical protein
MPFVDMAARRERRMDTFAAVTSNAAAAQSVATIRWAHDDHGVRLFGEAFAPEQVLAHSRHHGSELV